MKFSWEIRWNFSSKISAATGFCRDILIRFRCGRISRKEEERRTQNWRRSLSFAKYVIGVLVTRRVIERDRRSCGRVHRSARFDFNKLRSADHLCPLCLHRPSNFNPANFRIYSRDGGLKPLNRERKGRHWRRLTASRLNQLSGQRYQPRPCPARHRSISIFPTRHTHTDPRSSSSSSPTPSRFFIIVTVIRRYARFIFPSLYPPPLLDSTRRIETGGITGLNDIGFRRRIIRLSLSQTIGLIFLLLIYD